MHLIEQQFYLFRHILINIIFDYIFLLMFALGKDFGLQFVSKAKIISTISYGIVDRREWPLILMDTSNGPTSIDSRNTPVPWSNSSRRASSLHARVDEEWT